MNVCQSIFGFKDDFYKTTTDRFDRSKTGRMYYDDFIQACVVIQMLTEAFKEKDVDRRGKATFTYEEFVSLVLRAKFIL